MVQIEITSFLEKPSFHVSTSSPYINTSIICQNQNYQYPHASSGDLIDAISSEMFQGTEEYLIPNARPIDYDQLLELFHFSLSFGSFFKIRNFSFAALQDSFINAVPGQPVPSIIVTMVTSLITVILKGLLQENSDFISSIDFFFSSYDVEPFNFPFKTYQYTRKKSDIVLDGDNNSETEDELDPNEPILKNLSLECFIKDYKVSEYWALISFFFFQKEVWFFYFIILVHT